MGPLESLPTLPGLSAHACIGRWGISDLLFSVGDDATSYFVRAAQWFPLVAMYIGRECHQPSTSHTRQARARLQALMEIHLLGLFRSLRDPDFIPLSPVLSHASVSGGCGGRGLRHAHHLLQRGRDGKTGLHTQSDSHVILSSAPPYHPAPACYDLSTVVPSSSIGA